MKPLPQESNEEPLLNLKGHTALGMPAPGDPLCCSSGSEKGRQVLGTHTHGSHIILIGLPNFLHDLLLSPAAVLDGPLHGDGPLRVIECEVLQPAGTAEQHHPSTHKTGPGPGPE